MDFNNTDAKRLLLSRVEDYLRRADKGELVCGNFLTPAEAAYALSFCQQNRAGERVFLFGGYSSAERQRLFVLPSFLSDFDGTPKEKLEAYFPEELRTKIRAIRIKGSSYRALSHRDYLGSILALGIERSSIGDIVVEDDFSAIIFCTDKIFRFLLENLDRVASDKVTAEEFLPDGNFAPKQNLDRLSLVVASNRFDCIIGALTGLSRERAQEIIKSGICELDYLPELKCDKPILPPCKISARGYGKFNIVGFDGETKKGRLRLVADKYI